MTPNSVLCHLTIHIPFDQRVFHRTCRTLADAGYETHLLVQLDKPEANIEGIHLHAIEKPIPPRLGLQVWRRTMRLWRTLHLVHQIKADVYHLHAIELIPLGLWLKLRTNAKIIFDSHEDNISYVCQKKYIPRLVRGGFVAGIYVIEWLAARFFDAIITADVGVAEIYRTRYNANRVETIHNFPRLELFVVPPEANLIEKYYDLVYHGTMPRYHLEVAFEVAERLRDRGVETRWLFFGHCPEYEWAQAELQRRKLSGFFEIDPERVPHELVARRVLQAKIGFIPLPDLPKFQRNIPTKLFEYMSLGMPVVLSDLAASRPFVGDGKCAIMVPPNDYQAYADAIIRLLNDEALRTRMGEIGRQRVLENYNWESESKKLLRLYETLLQG